RFLTPVRLVRTFGLVLIVVGTAAVVWGVVVWRWQDPFTALYTRYEQHKLSAAYARRVSRLVPQRTATRRWSASRRSNARCAAPRACTGSALPRASHSGASPSRGSACG